MRWIEDKDEFRKAFLKARTCVYIDSGRERTALSRLTFDDAEICTSEFSGLLQNLMKWSEDPKSHYVVLDPDPVHYFYHHFKKFPVLEIAQGDSPDAYLVSLNEDPGGSPADAVGSNWWACVIAPPSLKWFVHALRSDQQDSGHLWIPTEWIDRVGKAYPYAHIGEDSYSE